jgi:hypothetical protein
VRPHADGFLELRGTEEPAFMTTTVLRMPSFARVESRSTRTNQTSEVGGPLPSVAAPADVTHASARVSRP